MTILRRRPHQPPPLPLLRHARPQLPPAALQGPRPRRWVAARTCPGARAGRSSPRRLQTSWPQTNAQTSREKEWPQTLRVDMSTHFTTFPYQWITIVKITINIT